MKNNLEIKIRDPVYKEIETYAKRDLTRELGGFLLGDYRKKGRFKSGFVLEIEAFIPAKHTDAQRGSITFTHDTWDDFHKVREAKYPGLKIVGWAHTHPNFGIFLSSYDEFIQRNFFKLEQQVAYVVDPVRNERGFFAWQDSELAVVDFARTDEYGKVLARGRSDRKKPADSKAKTAAAKKSGLLLKISGYILMAALLVATGFYLGMSWEARRTPVVTVPQQQLVLPDTKAEGRELPNDKTTPQSGNMSITP
ncbi:MAG: Mov34/MPN/PAD-1 family protein [Bacillota bacterium]